MAKRTRTEGPVPIAPSDPAVSHRGPALAANPPRSDPSRDHRSSAEGTAGTASGSSTAKGGAGPDKQSAGADADEVTAVEDKAARKAAKAARKAARKAANEPPADAAVPDAASSADEPPKKNHKKDKKKDKDRDGVPTENGAAGAAPTLDPALAGLLHTDQPALSGTSASSSTNGPARSHVGAAYRHTGDIPVDPVLLELRGVQAPANGLNGGAPAAEGAKQVKGKGKERALTAEPEAAPAAQPQEKEKKRRGRPPKAAAADGSADDAAGKTGKKVKKGLAGSLEEQFYEDLVTKWFTSRQLKDAAEAAGATYTQGRFTTTEDATIDRIISAFQFERSFKADDFRTWLAVKRATADKAAQRADTHDLWVRLGRALGTRPLLAIYNHVKIRYPAPEAAVAKGERWTDEDDARLRDAIREMGNSWERVGAAIGRESTSCRDRWTKQLNEGREAKKGSWTPEEEDTLRALVGEWGMQWKVVSSKMGGSRTATQCRTKWNDYLKRRDAASADPAGEGNFKWRLEDSSRLVHLIASHTPLPAHLTDLPWSTLAKLDAQLAPHGTKNLRDRFRPLANYAAAVVRRDKGLDEQAEVPLPDIVAALLVQHPRPDARPLKRPRLKTLTAEERAAERAALRANKFKSAETVDSSDDDDDDDDDDVEDGSGVETDLRVGDEEEIEVVPDVVVRGEDEHEEDEESAEARKRRKKEAKARRRAEKETGRGH